MTSHAKRSPSIRKVSILMVGLLFLLSGVIMGKEAAAASGPAEHSDSMVSEKKADFLLGKPKWFLGLHTGLFFPKADSDLFDMVTSELTLEKSDFRAWDFGFDFGFHLHDRIGLVFRCDYFDRSARSEFRDYVDEQGLPITQKTSFSQTSITAGVKYSLTRRGRRLSEFAWLPSRIVPFVECGIGTVHYSFEQSGDFVDSATLEIFPATLKSSDWTEVGYLGGGTDIYLLRNIYLALDLRYSWASQGLGKDFTGFDDIDLSGLRVTAGINWHF